MAGFLRRLFFGLGVMLGVLSPELAPSMTARLFRSQTELLASVELAGAFTPTALELAAAGNRVSLEVELSLKSMPEIRPARSRRTLRFDSLAGTWVLIMEPEALVKSTKDREAAILLASRFWALPIARLGDLEEGGSVLVVARVGLLDEEGSWHPAAILWGYAEPSRAFAFADPKELPY